MDEPRDCKLLLRHGVLTPFLMRALRLDRNLGIKNDFTRFAAVFWTDVYQSGVFLRSIGGPGGPEFSCQASLNAHSSAKTGKGRLSFDENNITSHSKQGTMLRHEYVYVTERNLPSPQQRTFSS